ncbi:hypothetical protein GCM10010361_53160 [Streptomyces olivaceiscleroticus]|uniref:Uncharacterized protein n=1 Tax=Streptomyces olivaceiscleroticus TaxID=68245 RepID=A0ABP3KNN8_9ACTN
MHVMDVDDLVHSCLQRRQEFGEGDGPLRGRVPQTALDKSVAVAHYKDGGAYSAGSGISQVRQEGFLAFPVPGRP